VHEIRRDCETVIWHHCLELDPCLGIIRSIAIRVAVYSVCNAPLTLQMERTTHSHANARTPPYFSRKPIQMIRPCSGSHCLFSIIPFLVLSPCGRSSSLVVIPSPCFSPLRSLSNLGGPVVDIVSVFLFHDNLMSREDIARNEHPAVVGAVATRWALQ
jgi:hypothetical protein